jgi:hypothetical protein
MTQTRGKEPSCGRFGHWAFEHWDLFRISNFEFRIFGEAFPLPLFIAREPETVMIP